MNGDMKFDTVLAEVTEKSDLYYKLPAHMRTMKVFRVLAEELNMRIIGIDKR